MGFNIFFNIKIMVQKYIKIAFWLCPNLLFFCPNRLKF